MEDFLFDEFPETSESESSLTEQFPVLNSAPIFCNSIELPYRSNGFTPAGAHSEWMQINRFESGPIPRRQSLDLTDVFRGKYTGLKFDEKDIGEDGFLLDFLMLNDTECLVLYSPRISEIWLARAHLDFFAHKVIVNRLKAVQIARWDGQIRFMRGKLNWSAEHSRGVMFFWSENNDGAQIKWEGNISIFELTINEEFVIKFSLENPYSNKGLHVRQIPTTMIKSDVVYTAQYENEEIVPYGDSEDRRVFLRLFRFNEQNQTVELEEEINTGAKNINTNKDDLSYHMSAWHGNQNFAICECADDNLLFVYELGTKKVERIKLAFESWRLFKRFNLMTIDDDGIMSVLDEDDRESSSSNTRITMHRIPLRQPERLVNLAIFASMQKVDISDDRILPPPLRVFSSASWSRAPHIAASVLNSTFGFIE